MAIKSVPDDFQVEESLTRSFLDTLNPRAGRFAVYSVRKRSLTTHELLDRLARRLKVPLGDVAAAGLKDKQAVTTQHVSVRVDDSRRPLLDQFEGEGYLARRIGFAAEAIDSRAIEANHFRIVIRSLGRPAVDEMRQAARRYREPDQTGGDQSASLLVVNYFGNQRFGSARAGRGFIAAHLIRGEFEQALRLAIAEPHRKDERRVKQFKTAVSRGWNSREWKPLLVDLPRLPERACIEHLARKPDDFRGGFAALPYFFQQLVVEAYQSLLWNRIAATLLVDRLGESGRLWVLDDKFGQLVFPEAAAIPEELISLDLPVLGRRTELRSPWKDAAERVLAEDQIAGVDALHLRGLDKPWFAESARRLFMRVEQFELGPPQRDEQSENGSRFKATATFTLPRGGYATVVLRALGE